MILFFAFFIVFFNLHGEKCERRVKEILFTFIKSSFFSKSEFHLTASRFYRRDRSCEFFSIVPRNVIWRHCEKAVLSNFKAASNGRRRFEQLPE